MASRAELYKESRGLIDSLRAGERDPGQLTERDRLLYAVGRGKVTLDDLNDEGVDLLGLDRSFGERVSRVVSPIAAGATGLLESAMKPEPPRRVMSPAEESVSGAVEAASAEPLTRQIRDRIGSPPSDLLRIVKNPVAAAAHSGADLLLRALEPVERGFAGLAGGIEAPLEQALEQLPRLVGQEPKSTFLSRAVPVVATNLAQFLPTLRRPKLYDAARETARPSIPEPRPETQKRLPPPRIQTGSEALARTAPADLPGPPFGTPLLESTAEKRLPGATVAPMPALPGILLGEQKAIAGTKPIPQGPVPETRGQRIPASMVRPRTDVALPTGPEEPRALTAGPTVRGGEQIDVRASARADATLPPRAPYERAQLPRAIPAEAEGDLRTRREVVGAGREPAKTPYRESSTVEGQPQGDERFTVAARAEPLPPGTAMLLGRDGQPILDEAGRPILMPPPAAETPPLPTQRGVAARRAGVPERLLPPPPELSDAGEPAKPVTPPSPAAPTAVKPGRPDVRTSDANRSYGPNRYQGEGGPGARSLLGLGAATVGATALKPLAEEFAGRQTDEDGEPLMLAGPGGSIRVPRPPGAGRPPRVAPEFARERIGGVTPPPSAPPPAEPPRTPPPAVGGRPPSEPPLGPPEATPPRGPAPRPQGRIEHLREVIEEGIEATGDVLNRAFRPTIGRLEQMGEAGKELSRRVLGVDRTKRQTLGRVGEPVAQKLDRLSTAEKENLRQLLEGETARPMNAKVAAAHSAFRSVMGDERSWLVQEARKRGIVVLDREGQAREFTPRRNFFPHEYDEPTRREFIEPRSERRRQAIRHLLDTGQAADEEQAGAMLNERFGARYVEFGGTRYILDPDRYVGGLERARDLDLPGYIADPAKAFRIRMDKVARRFAELDHYGPLDNVVGQPGGTLLSHNNQWFEPMPAGGLIGQIQRQAGKGAADAAYRLFHQQLGTRPEGSEALRNTARRITTVEAMMDLPLAVIQDASQTLVQGPIRTDVTTIARGMWRAARAEGRRAAQDLGVFNDQILRDVMAEASGTASTAGPISRKVLGLFNAQEQINQTIGVNAGRVWADKLERTLQSGRSRTQAWVEREFDRLGFRDEEVAAIRERGTLTPDERDRIAWNINDQINFTARRARRSEFANTPWGSVVLMYKSFAANAGRLVKQTVIDEARHGNFAPATRLLALGFGVGEVVQDARALIRGSERPDSIEHRALDNLSAVAGLGLAASYMESLVRGGLSAGAEFAVGPALSTAFRWSSSLMNWVKALDSGDAFRERAARRELGRQVVRKVPYVGPYASEQLRSDAKGQARQQQTAAQRLRLDPADRQLREVESIDRRAKVMLREANQLAAQGESDEARKLVEDFNAEYGTAYQLNRGAIRRRQREAADSEAARRRRLSPGVRGRAAELPDLPASLLGGALR